MGRVVVGVDGSERSKKALRRGVEEAALRHTLLEAVYVFPSPHKSLTDTVGGLPHNTTVGQVSRSGAADPFAEARREALGELEEIVGDALAGSDAAKPRLVVIPNDDVPEALVDHADGADLLIIGLRRRSPVGKLVLGSDARDIILQARTAVLAVKDDEDEFGSPPAS